MDRFRQAFKQLRQRPLAFSIEHGMSCSTHGQHDCLAGSAMAAKAKLSSTRRLRGLRKLVALGA